MQKSLSWLGQEIGVKNRNDRKLITGILYKQGGLGITRDRRMLYIKDPLYIKDQGVTTLSDIFFCHPWDWKNFSWTHDWLYLTWNYIKFDDM